MRAIVINSFGGSEAFEEREIPRPAVVPGRVLVRVAASSVNPVDTKIRSGMLAAIAPEFPDAVLGCDMAGVVEEIGDGVEDFTVGDEVFGCAGGVLGHPGALAEFQLVDPRLIARKPRSLDMAEAAALPLVGITAWDALIDRTGIRAGQRVLVFGATGGVGHVGVQLARAAGARVFATASSPEKLAIAMALGAEVGIDYRAQSIDDIVAEHTGGDGFDVVFDTVGGENVQRCFAAAARCGTVASISTRCTCDLTPLHQKALSLHVTFMLLPLLTGAGRARHGEILRALATMVDEGELRPLVHAERFTFANVGAAHALLERGGAVGKIVLTP